MKVLSVPEFINLIDEDKTFLEDYTQKADYLNKVNKLFGMGKANYRDMPLAVLIAHYTLMLDTPFKPEMIVKMFKGFEEVKGDWTEKRNRAFCYGGKSVKIYFENSTQIFAFEGDSGIYSPKCADLGMFNNLCKIAEIELEWNV